MSEASAHRPRILLGDSEHSIVDANRAATRILGFTRDERLRMHAGELLHPDEQVRFASVFQDITGRKQTEQKLQEATERYKQAERTAHVGHWEMESTTGYCHWSDEFFRICGYEPQSFAPTGEMGLEIVHPDDRDRAKRLVNQALENGHVYDVEKRVLRPSGEVRWVHSRGTTIDGKDGKPTKIAGTMLDITERKEAEERLKTSIEENDLLMQELNHRVKNNLAMVSSLIVLKQDVLGDAVDLSDTRSQISAIRFVHEKLEYSKDLGYIDFGPYIDEVLSGVFSSDFHGNVRIENHIGEITVPTKEATTLGLIVSELAINARKHGLSPETDHHFGVSMETDHDSQAHVLIVSNTGRPFPHDIDMENPKTLGLQLVKAMTEQLGGTLDLKREPYPVFRIRFPRPE